MTTTTRPYLRYLRIAFSAVCGLAVVLLCVLWVRSYWWADILSYRDVGIPVWRYESNRGAVWFHYQSNGITHLTKGWHFYSSKPDNRKPYAGVLEFYYTHSPHMQTIVSLPIWSIVLTALIITPAPWLPFRFSLRTLLIATTLLAATLGLIIATTR